MSRTDFTVHHLLSLNFPLSADSPLLHTLITLHLSLSLSPSSLSRAAKVLLPFLLHLSQLFLLFFGHHLKNGIVEEAFVVLLLVGGEGSVH